MNTSQIKNFAIQSRNVLKEGVFRGRNEESSFGDMDKCIYLHIPMLG